MGVIKKGVVNFKNRLLRLNDDEPLSKLSFVVIIALDFFILTILFAGLSDHTSQLTQPYEYVPSKCRSVFIEKSWNNANNLDNLQELVLSDYNHYHYRDKSTFKNAKIGLMHFICAEFYEKVKIIAENNHLKNLFINRQNLIKQKKSYSDKFNKSKSVYDTSLMEDIAGKNEQDNKLASISTSMQNLSTQIESLNSKIKDIDSELNNNHLVAALLSTVDFKNNNYRMILVRDLKRFEFIYPIKELGWQLLFMLPIFIVFYIWYARSVKKHNNISCLISSHLLVVAAWPIILKTIEVVLDLIPRHFFKKLFQYLELLHLVAIWHYMIIFISICVTLLVIYLIQKKLFSKEMIYQKRLMRNACYRCGKKLPEGVKACPFCGTKQVKTCPHCNKLTFFSAAHCTNCGDKI